jgi:hypothetical protein
MNLKEYLKDKIQSLLIEHEEICYDCESIAPKYKTLHIQENIAKFSTVSLNMQYHIEKELPLCESVFRVGSEAYVKLYKEARVLEQANLIELAGNDKWLIENTQIGEREFYENELVALDVPFVYNEAEFKGEKVQLNKPKRGGSKKYYVYVKNPKTKKIKKVSFGYPGMSVKIGNKKLSQAFAKRHDCKNKKDRTKASYWSCNLPRYASLLGLGKPASRYW